MDTSNKENKLGSWIYITSILIIVNCLAMIPSMAYVPLVPSIKKAITMNFSQAGLFLGLPGILAIVCAVPAGMAIKRFGARKVLLSGSVFMIAGLMLLSFATDFTGLLSGRGIWQIGIRFLLPALTAALVVSVPDKHRSTALGINISVSMAGTWAAQIIGAKMSLSYGWQTSIQFFAAIVALAAVISFIFYRGKAAAQGEALKADKTAVNPNEKSVYAMPSVWLLCLLVIFACEEGLVDGIASLQMAEKWNTDALQFAKITGWGIGLAIIINLVAGWCGDKYGRWNMLIASGVLNTMVGVCLWLGEINHKGIYITGILIAKGLQMTTTLFVNSMAPTFLKGRDVGPIIAIIMLGGGLGQYLGPQVLGIFRDVTGSYTAGWIYIAACGVMATMFAIGFKLYFDRKQKAEAAGGKV